MKKANVKILKTMAMVFCIASAIMPCTLIAITFASSVIQSEEVSSVAAESLMADAVPIESVPETIAETTVQERLDFSALITNPGKNTLIALSRSGNNYGKWEQDQNGDMFFVFSGSKRSGNVATNGWYAIEDKEVDEKIVASR